MEDKKLDNIKKIADLMVDTIKGISIYNGKYITDYFASRLFENDKSDYYKFYGDINNVHTKNMLHVSKHNLVSKNILFDALEKYKNIENKELMSELIDNYYEMKIAQLNDDILEYSRRLSCQMESCFNYMINKVNAWNCIKTDHDSGRNIYGSGDKSLYNGEYPFFKKNKKRLEIKKISMLSKIYFAQKYYDASQIRVKNNFIYNHDIFYEIREFRNFASHGSGEGLKEVDRRVYNIIKEHNKIFKYKIRNDDFTCNIFKFDTENLKESLRYDVYHRFFFENILYNLKPLFK